MENLDIKEVRLLLGDASDNFSDEQISLVLDQTYFEITSYCNRQMDEELRIISKRVTVIKLQRMNTEGLSSFSASGVSESYVDGYPADIIAILNRKRKIKVVG